MRGCPGFHYAQKRIQETATEGSIRAQGIEFFELIYQPAATDLRRDVFPKPAAGYRKVMFRPPATLQKAPASSVLPLYLNPASSEVTRQLPKPEKVDLPDENPQ